MLTCNSHATVSGKTPKDEEKSFKKLHNQKAVDLAPKAAKRILFIHQADLISRCLHTLFTHVIISTHVYD
jgi:hypothetical protein